MRNSSTLTDRVKTELGKVLYPPVYALGKYSERVRERRHEERIRFGGAPEEPFSADVVRGLYWTLEYFHIPDPKREYHHYRSCPK